MEYFLVLGGGLVIVALAAGLYWFDCLVELDMDAMFGKVVTEKTEVDDKQ